MTSKTPPKENVPNNWDLYPLVYREFKDGHLNPKDQKQVKLEENTVNSAMKNTKGDEIKDGPDLHPLAWKEFVDNHAKTFQKHPQTPE